MIRVLEIILELGSELGQETLVGALQRNSEEILFSSSSRDKLS